MVTSQRSGCRFVSALSLTPDGISGCLLVNERIESHTCSASAAARARAHRPATVPAAIGPVRRGFAVCMRRRPAGRRHGRAADLRLMRWQVLGIRFFCMHICDEIHHTCDELHHACEETHHACVETHHTRDEIHQATTPPEVRWQVNALGCRCTGRVLLL